MKWISASLNFCVTCIKLTVLSMGVQGVHPRSLVTAWSVWCWRRGCTCDRKDVPVSASMVLEALHPTTFVYMGWSHDFPLQERGQVLDKLETPHDNCSLQAASSDPHRCRGEGLIHTLVCLTAHAHEFTFKGNTEFRDTSEGASHTKCCRFERKRCSEKTKSISWRDARQTGGEGREHGGMVKAKTKGKKFGEVEERISSLLTWFSWFLCCPTFPVSLMCFYGLCFAWSS